MEHRFFDLLCDATREVFETMSFMEVVQEPPVQNSDDLKGVEITASICLAGEISGILTFHCSRKFIRQCAEVITGQDNELAEDDLCDTAGELANMIAGSLKRRLSTLIDLFVIGLPSVISSSGHRVSFQGMKEDFPRLVLPFSTEGQEKFFVEMLYHMR